MVVDLEVLVREIFAIDTLASRSIGFIKVSTCKNIFYFCLKRTFYPIENGFFSQAECVVNQVDSFVWENIPVFIVLLYFVNIQAFISLFLGSCFWSRIIIVYTCTTGTCIKFTKSKKSLECPVKTWTRIPTRISKSFLPYIRSKPVFSISKACPIP